MAPSPVENLEKLLAAGKDSAMLRFGLGNAYLTAGDAARAVDHFTRATELDPGYSAAWKQLGKALEQAGRSDEALQTYQRGIDVADAKGDKQAAKEMAVFVRRLERQKGGPA